MPPLVEFRNFSKSFGKVEAVHGLSFQVEPGELFGLIGPDGAGKTTTMRTLVTLLKPDSGSVTVKGLDVQSSMTEIRSITGYMPQRFSLYPDLSIDQNLAFFADLFGVPKDKMQQRKDRLYKFSRLHEFKERLAGRLSGGMKQKLALSCTLIHDPLLLVLDEPTTGVDPVSRNEFWDILRDLKSQGVTIIVSTPYMDEALLCDRVVIMHEGRMLAAGEPKCIADSMTKNVFAIYERTLVMKTEMFMTIPCILSVHSFGDNLHVTTPRDCGIDTLRSELEVRIGAAISVEQIAPSLEDVFISLVEEGAHA